jgi:small-conductance mechanosensitive channel
MPSRGEEAGVNAELKSELTGWLLDPLTGKLALLFVGLVVIVVAVRLLRRAMTHYVSNNTSRYRSRKVMNASGYVAAAILTMLIFSDKLGGLTVAFGVAGAGVAFALQEVIASVAGWSTVSFGGFYKVGDRVQLGGIKGDVIDIGVLRTTIMEIGEWVGGDQYNGRIVRVANSFVFKAPVFNYSADFPFLWDEITIPIKYGSDHQMARALVTRVADEVVGEYARSAEQAWKPITERYLITPASVLPIVTLIANANWIEFTLRYVVDYKTRRATQDRLFTRVLEEIDKCPDRVGIAASALNAASTLNIEKVPPVEVRLSRS